MSDVQARRYFVARLHTKMRVSGKEKTAWSDDGGAFL